MGGGTVVGNVVAGGVTVVGNVIAVGGTAVGNVVAGGGTAVGNVVAGGGTVVGNVVAGYGSPHRSIKSKNLLVPEQELNPKAVYVKGIRLTTNLATAQAADPKLAAPRRYLILVPRP